MYRIFKPSFLKKEYTASDLEMRPRGIDQIVRDLRCNHYYSTIGG